MNQPDIPEIVPEGVELHAFDDIDYWREDVYTKAKSALEESFPRDYGTVTLELEDLQYRDIEQGPSAEKRHLLERTRMMRPLKGTVRLRDKETGEVLDEVKNRTVMSVPHLSNRGTYIHNGSNYASIRQARLLPGAYSRRKKNGELEVHYNVKPGSGKGFRVKFEPDTALFRMDIGGASLKLYSVLKELGVPDERLLEAWGPEVFKANQSRYDARDLNKLFTKLFRYEKPGDFTQEEKRQKIKDGLQGGLMLKSTVERTLGL